MKLQALTIGGMSLLVFTSCSSVRKLSDRDSPVTTTMTKKPRNTERKFLEGIEMTPGGTIASTAFKPVYLNKPAETVQPTEIMTSPGESVSRITIESANMLQLKYAVAMDVTVEKLTNLPLLEVIDKWWGTRYCMGGITQDCLDCSAFTQIIMRDVYRQPLPRTAQEQYNSAGKVELEDLKEGDLVFFNTSGKDISHVGVYLLNNKFVHAATSGGVLISDLNDSYWQPKYRGAGRIK
jgi:hypothetical protein